MGSKEDVSHFYRDVTPNLDLFVEVCGVSLTADQKEVVSRVSSGESDLYLKYPYVGGEMITQVLAAWRLLTARDRVIWVFPPSIHLFRRTWLQDFKELMRSAPPIVSDMFRVTDRVAVQGYSADRWGLTGGLPSRRMSLHDPHLDVFVLDARSLPSYALSYIQSRPKSLDFPPLTFVGAG